MISKNKQKYITALQQKKYRTEYGVFLVEGGKSVLEVLDSVYEVEELIGTRFFLEENVKGLKNRSFSIEEASAEELTKVGTLQENHTALAIVKTRPNEVQYAETNEWVLVLDDLRDPGNLGAIVRVADWYGIGKIVASPSTVEFYNPKVIMASMGSFTRVNVAYTPLPQYLEKVDKKCVFGTFLEGQNIHNIHKHTQGGYVIIGNEAKGISAEIAGFVGHRLTIPRWGKAESLNASIATAIVLDNLRKTEC